MGRFIYVCIFATFIQMSNRRVIIEGDNLEELKVTVDRAPSGEIQVELETPPDDAPEILDGQISDDATSRTSHSPGNQLPPALFDFSQYHPSFPTELWHFLNHLMACLSAQSYHEGIFIPDVLLDSPTASQDGEVHSANETKGASDNEIGPYEQPMRMDITDTQNPQPSTSQRRSPPLANFPDIPEDVWDLLRKQ